MKCVLFLYVGSDSTKAETLKDYLQTKLRAVAEFRNITDILAEEQELSEELPNSDCVVLISSQQASTLIRKNGQEIEDDFITFDGSVIRQELSTNHNLVGRLVIVRFFTKVTNYDHWIPDNFDERRIFHLPEEIKGGSPELDQLEDCIKGILVPLANNRR